MCYNRECAISDHFQVIVAYLRQLLNGLKGSPVGFKLNIELNHFFLDCFSYHVDLWGIFIGNYDEYPAGRNETIIVIISYDILQK